MSIFAKYTSQIFCFCPQLFFRTDFGLVPHFHEKEGWGTGPPVNSIKVGFFKTLLCKKQLNVSQELFKIFYVYTFTGTH